jgi:pimeloyl-ACP methyl ester carboxylesterase
VTYALLALVLYPVGSYLLARHYLSPGRQTFPLPLGLAEVSIPSGSGPFSAWSTLGLAGGSPQGRTVFVLVHGYGGSRAAYRELLFALDREGFEAVAPSMPAHEDHPARTCGFGRTEAQGVLEATAWARSRYDVPPRVVLVGVSMGGAAVWLASAEDPTVDAVVTEGAFARLDPTIDRWFDLTVPGGRFVLRPVRWIASRMSGSDPRSINPVDAAGTWKGRPSLVIHCGFDRLMPVQNAQMLAEASGAELWTIENAGHAHGFSSAPDEYVRRLSCLGRWLERDPS